MNFVCIVFTGEAAESDGGIEGMEGGDGGRARTCILLERGNPIPEVRGSEERLNLQCR